MKHFFYTIAAIALLSSCQMNKPVNSGNDMVAKNEQVTQRFYDEVINKHDISKIDSFIAPSFVDHQTMSGKPETLNIDTLKAGMKGFFAMYPDVHYTVNFMLADSNTVMADWTQTGTNTGMTVWGEPATNKSATVSGVDIIKLKDGKAVEHWGYYEERRELGQLGMKVVMNDTTMMKKDMKKKK